MGQVTKVGLSCDLVLLSFDSKTRSQDRQTFVTWPIWCWLWFKLILFLYSLDVSLFLIPFMQAVIVVYPAFSFHIYIYHNRSSNSLSLQIHFLMLLLMNQIFTNAFLSSQGYLWKWIWAFYEWRFYAVVLALNASRARQNGCHFSEDIFRWIFLMKTFQFQIKFHCHIFLNNILIFIYHINLSCSNSCHSNMNMIERNW